MKLDLDQSAYWSAVAGEKQFRHAINWAWLSQYLEPEAAILDYGCGTGRLTAEIAERGYRHVTGMDYASGMIQQAKENYPGLNFRLNQQAGIDVPDASRDLVLLCTVLTCIPQTTDQESLVQEIYRLLKPGGLLYISDLLINGDARNKARYDAFPEGPYGIFEHAEGTRLRHHTQAYLQEHLLAAFTPLEVHPFSVITMNGNPSQAIQLLAQKPGAMNK